jgi:hypothetical protein
LRGIQPEGAISKKVLTVNEIMLLPWRQPPLQHLEESPEPGAELSLGEFSVLHAVHREVEDGDPDRLEPASISPRTPVLVNETTGGRIRRSFTSRALIFLGFASVFSGKRKQDDVPIAA